MKLQKLLILSLFAFTLGQAQTNFDLVPRPVNIQISNGFFTIPQRVIVHVSAEFKESANLLSEYPGIKEIVLKRRKNADIKILKSKITSTVEGAYELSISNKGIEIKANDREGAINGIFTLIQLGMLQNNSAQLGYVEIKDQPRFGYRGLHLDVSRNFMAISFVKKYIDLMALYHLNEFHWHLTDGAGWRLEIKKYPKLTQLAAWRNYITWKDWWNNGRQYVEQGTPNASGGFYTQEQAKEIVKYAADRGINVIPEIEMPGHSEEVLAVYPELSCTDQPYLESDYCVGKPEVFTFLKNVLDEVMAIFPSKYIHIGGDEAGKQYWKTCASCQALMQKNGYTSVDQLQSYFIHQIDQYVQSKGRKIIGWDEILEGGLSPGATVMSWRGESGGIKAAQMHHDVIMTPGAYLYFDSYQSDPRFQPEASGGYVPIEKVYSYNPVPKELATDEQKYILGAQANLWTEYVNTPEHAEYMVFPRALALSEVVWTPQNERDYRDFQRRLQSQYKVLQKLGVNYYRPSYAVEPKVDFDAVNKTDSLTLVSEQNVVSGIHYTLDGSEPGATSPVYSKPLFFDKSGIVKASYFLNDRKVGPEMTKYIDIHKAIGKKVIYNQSWDSYAAQGTTTLTNGIFGGLSYHDEQWQGFTRGMDAVVDFEQPTAINSVAMNFMQLTGPGIYMPGELEVLVSNDNVNYTEVGKVLNDVSPKEDKLTFKRFELKLAQPVTARYLRIKTTNPGHGFQFTDEIIVY